MKNTVKVTRKTTESQMAVTLEFSAIKPDYRTYIQTPIPFFSHMIEHIAWRGGFNISTQIDLDKFFLTHVVCEDLGITMGKAVAEYVKNAKADGVVGFGDGIGIIDEAKATAAISFENRAYIDINKLCKVPETVEGMASEDLETFLEGFVQGACCTLHIDVEKGENAHHIWEAVFRSLGTALNRALSVDPARKGMSSGVAGNIEFIVE